MSLMTGGCERETSLLVELIIAPIIRGSRSCRDTVCDSADHPEPDHLQSLYAFVSMAGDS